MRSLPTHRARIIAANNILNALFMIVSAIGVGLLLKAAFTNPQVFLLVGLLNAVVAFCIFLPVPVIPLARTNLWSSYSSRVAKGTALVRPFRCGLFSRVGLTVGAAVPAAEVTPAGLRQRVEGLLAAAR